MSDPSKGQPPSLRDIDTFGDVAAEDDAVLDYFLSTNAVDRIEKNEAFLVLGRKGAGKTAIVRYFTEGGKKTLSKALNLRGYPWNVHEQRIDRGASDIEAYVSSWRYLIAIEIASLVLAQQPTKPFDAVTDLQTFLKENYGGTSPALSDILRPQRLKISKLSLQPSVMGTQLGGIELLRENKDFNFGLELNALSKSIIDNAVGVARFNNMGRLILHFDELDQGLSELDGSRKKMLIGLILAAREVRRESDGMVNPVVYLRTDLWDDFQFSDKNKISQTDTLHLEWSDQTLLDLIERRLRAKFGREVKWSDIAEADLMRGSQPKWNHILARTFLRPRDVIKFLNVALSEAKGRDASPLRFTNEDIVNSREEYSAYLKKELDDEILPHWNYWEEALQACSGISTITFDRVEFEAEYAKRRSKENEVETDGALSRLYRFSVIGYGRRSGYGGSSWAFQYTDPQAGWANAAAQFKVHLGLKEYAKLREKRAQSGEDVD
jgi:hypothetical protein